MIPENPENESRVQPSLAENPRTPMFRRCISSIVHAIHCHQENCTDDPTCHKMKCVIYHTRVCRRRVQGSCPVCKQFLALCFLHCKYCMDDDCVVPFCSAVKESVQRIQLPGSANDRPTNDFAIPL